MGFSLPSPTGFEAVAHQSEGKRKFRSFGQSAHPPPPSKPENTAACSPEARGHPAWQSRCRPWSCTTHGTLRESPPPEEQNLASKYMSTQNHVKAAAPNSGDCPLIFTCPGFDCGSLEYLQPGIKNCLPSACTESEGWISAPHFYGWDGV